VALSHGDNEVNTFLAGISRSGVRVGGLPSRGERGEGEGKERKERVERMISWVMRHTYVVPGSLSPKKTCLHRPKVKKTEKRAENSPKRGGGSAAHGGEDPLG
jgi:hypothetical protein